MRAHARLAVTAGHHRGTRIDRLRSDPPWMLRPTLNTDQPVPGWSVPGAAHVSLAAATAGPLGGDRLRLDVDVAAEAALVLRTVAATLALPGPHGDASSSESAIRVGPGGTLIWLPEPTIAAKRCHHHGFTRVHLGEGARLITREEVLLGRHGERPGTVRQRLRVGRGDHPLHDQELCLDDEQQGWAGPAVTGGRKALGTLLLVGPLQDVPGPRAEANVAALWLDESSMLVTALSHDALTLRRVLDRHMRLATGSAGSAQPSGKALRDSGVQSDDAAELALPNRARIDGFEHTL